LLYAYQPKGRKEEPVVDKDEEAPQYIDKKINTG
jgi:GcrA cell cycle regulator